MSVPWTEKGFLVVGDHSLEYACFGPSPEKAATLVLLHEGLGCTQLWRGFPSELAAATGCSVFAYSRAGYGHSDPVKLPRPLDYMTREAVDVLPEILRLAGIQRAVIVGHSDGATIAALYAGSVVNQHIDGIVLMAPHFFTEPAGLVEIARAQDIYNQGELREKLGKYHRDPDNAFRGWNDAWLDPEFVQWNVAGVLDNICVPVLAIQGRDDPYGTLDQIDAVTQGVHHAPVSTLILEGCGHAPHLEKSDQVVEAIASFTKRCV